MGDEMAARAAVEVFEDHLRLGQQGTVEEDLVRNYADDVVVLTADGVHRGHDGVRELAKLLDRQLPDATFTYTAQVIAGEVGFLEWTARAADGTRVEDGPTPSSSATAASGPRPSTTPSNRPPGTIRTPAGDLKGDHHERDRHAAGGGHDLHRL